MNQRDQGGVLRQHGDALTVLVLWLPVVLVLFAAAA
jgi:hypothetical protein